MRACKVDWGDERAGLEPRELEDVLEQCDEASAALTAMRRAGTTCDELRALYLE
ncbi:MAG: hypothetical protein H6742_11280 [Alphaproteobacteria bacterium]|nr:hypothetical protein [Alphaproteobacteria bacterium]